MENFDIIIIGAGPAGLTAGLYAGRQNSKALVIDKGLAGGLCSEVPMMENYPGFDLRGLVKIRTWWILKKGMMEST